MQHWTAAVSRVSCVSCFPVTQALASCIHVKGKPSNFKHSSNKSKQLGACLKHPISRSESSHSSGRESESFLLLLSNCNPHAYLILGGEKGRVSVWKVQAKKMFKMHKNQAKKKMKTRRFYRKRRTVHDSRDFPWKRKKVLSKKVFQNGNLKELVSFRIEFLELSSFLEFDSLKKN